MKRKYKCQNCGHENIVDISDMIATGLGGMGGRGLIADEMGLDIMAAAGFLSGLSSQPKNFKHNCTNCGTANIVQIT